MLRVQILNAGHVVAKTPPWFNSHQPPFSSFGALHILPNISFSLYSWVPAPMHIFYPKAFELCSLCQLTTYFNCLASPLRNLFSFLYFSILPYHIPNPPSLLEVSNVTLNDKRLRVVEQKIHFTSSLTFSWYPKPFHPREKYECFE